MSDNILREIFPDWISRDDAVGGPGFNTTIVRVQSGDEFRNREWEQSRYKYTVSHAARVPRRIDPLVNHFLNAGGSEKVFPFKDWSDFEVGTGEGLFIDADGGGKQMVKRYGSGASEYLRIIRLPKEGTITVTGGGTVDYDTGIVTGGTPTRWVGQFYVACRYDTDQMDLAILEKKPNGDLIKGWRDIPIIEVREDLEEGS